ncbi:MAG: hypothetical protein CFE44_09925 [Burkholderiales bacterium PBB4]|nr:MAG: hypothetical protein CFE44_09925 [Burkholderiales bacterium PBB4]
MAHSMFSRRAGTPFLLTTLGLALTGCGGGSSSPSEPLPSVVSTTPANGALAVLQSTRLLTASFSKQMDASSLSAASVRVSCDGAAINGSVGYSASNNMASFTLANGIALPASALCNATLDKAVKDTTGLALGSDYVWSFRTSVAIETVAPTVTTTVQANGAKDVAFNTKIGASFSEPMAPASITTDSVVLTESTAGSKVAGSVSYVGLSVVFKPSVALKANTQYTFTIKGGTGGVSDLAGNTLARDFAISWTTGASADTLAPIVLGSNYANGSSNVAVNTKIGVSFSEGMDPQTLTTTSFMLTSGALVVPGIVSTVGNNAVFVPNANLLPATTYTLTLKGGALGAADLAGNPLAQDFQRSWTTSGTPDLTPPTVAETLNDDGATGVPITTKIAIRFSELLDPLTITTGNFLVSAGATPVLGTLYYSGESVVFLPLKNLAPNTQHTITVTGGKGEVTDLSGNALIANYVYRWTTGSGTATTAPTVVSSSYATGTTNVALSARPTFTFSENIDPLTATVANFMVQSGTTPIAGTVVYNGVTLVFTPAQLLSPYTEYTTTLRGSLGGISDLSGNAMNDDVVVRWTTGQNF